MPKDGRPFLDLGVAMTLRRVHAATTHVMELAKEAVGAKVSWRRRASAGVVLFAFAALPARAAADLDGARIYRRDCARCHGAHGRGDGPDAGIFTNPPRNLRTEFLTKYSTPELVRRVRRGMPLNLDVDPQALEAQSREVTALVAHVERLPLISWERVDAGREIYGDRCESCHGIYGHPVGAGSSAVRTTHDLSDPAFQRDTSDDALRTLVRHDRAGMPRLTPALTEPQSAAVAAYVRLFSPGFELYGRFCVNCHGDSGRGAPSASPAARNPTVLDGEYFARHDAAHVREAVWHMVAQKKPQMPHLRHAVSETAAQAIIRFLKSLHEQKAGDGKPPGAR